MKTPLHKTIIWLGIFAIAMGFLESSVVIYLRELYYPEGFKFPLQIIPQKIARVELWREAATIIMLIGAGYMAGKTKLTRFGYFLIAFAVWDLFYYIFLYLFIQWPENLLTWDILFLIPFPWTGPVIAPCLVAVGMIILGVQIVRFNEARKAPITYSQRLLLLSGCFIIILSFLSDYFHAIGVLHRDAAFLPSSNGLLEELKTYVPEKFDWLLFLSGLCTSCIGVINYSIKYRSYISNLKPINHENK